MTKKQTYFNEADRKLLNRILATLIECEVYDNPVIPILKRAARGEGLDWFDAHTVQTILTGVAIGDQLKRKGKATANVR